MKSGERTIRPVRRPTVQNVARSELNMKVGRPQTHLGGLGFVEGVELTFLEAKPLEIAF
jgi:hypothetical protein